MYAYIIGEVVHKEPEKMIIENSGIGYILCVRMGMLRKPYFPNQQIKISFATILDT